MNPPIVSERSLTQRVAALVCLLPLLWSVLAPAQTAPNDAEEESALRIHVFKSDTCPHCQEQRPWLEQLERDTTGLDVRYYEIVATREHHDLLRRMAAAHEVRPGSTPMTFLGGKVWVGDSPQIRREVEAQLEQCLRNGCPDSIAWSEQKLAGDAATGDAHHDEAIIDIPVLGQLDLTYQPLLVSTAIIAFVDGFNPCSLWLLSILIALVLHSGSRKRVLVVGLSFLTVTALIYGLFMVGVFSVLAYASFLPWMYWTVAIFALVFGAVNIKDYFWFKKGLSFTISDKHKPGIFKGFRELMTDGKSYLALAGATIVMAAGIALIELPCTAGFPVIWSGLISSHDVSVAEFVLLLGIYLIIYLLDELVVFGIAVVKLRIDRFEEKQARVLKLIGGVVMIALAIVLVTEPEIMNNIGQALGVFALAFAIAGLIVLVDRKFLKREASS
ncbi:MAG: thioredoxin [Wenzhouxiangellaceae bacterium]|nr:thioredoxin [Wenzhouxiangellaceae bacterium]